jgi:hypothetical protein
MSIFSVSVFETPEQFVAAYLGKQEHTELFAKWL